MEPLRLALALAALLGLSSAILEVEIAHRSVTVIQGQRAILPAWYTTSSVSMPYVTWHLERPGQRLQILAFMSGTKKVENRNFEQRLDFLYPMPFSNVSIAINNTKETDSGQYMCTVNVPDDSTVNGRNIGLVNLTVLDTKKGLLILKNLTTEMSGIYVCNASSVAGHSKCTLALKVHPPFNAAVVAGAVVGTLLGLGLIIFFTLQMFVYRKKKKEAQDEMANEIKEDAVAPKTLTWVKSSGSDGISKNGTLSSLNTTRDHKPYPTKPPSDTASITTATGSMVGFKPPFNNPRSGALTPTPSLSSQTLPLYFPPVINGNQCHHANMPGHRNTLHRTNGAQPQAPQKQEAAVLTSQGLTPSTLNRMGAVPVMVPAQSQAGSLV